MTAPTGDDSEVVQQHVASLCLANHHPTYQDQNGRRAFIARGVSRHREALQMREPNVDDKNCI